MYTESRQLRARPTPFCIRWQLRGSRFRIRTLFGSALASRAAAAIPYTLKEMNALATLLCILVFLIAVLLLPALFVVFRQLLYAEMTPQENKSKTEKNEDRNFLIWP
ncbi:hypothetical protein EHV15_36150 [Paenibacillus oralis]|uniref:Uncharacterized protein n=1 Tax=Paenibacillus oralis TaxID=2490856 RepID=A0A3P3T7J7_9BACL|nr:hypothetical protein EHV15_36150 [Paenibacillus oralis]